MRLYEFELLCAFNPYYVCLFCWPVCVCLCSECALTCSGVYCRKFIVAETVSLPISPLVICEVWPEIAISQACRDSGFFFEKKKSEKEGGREKR